MKDVIQNVKMLNNLLIAISIDVFKPMLFRKRGLFRDNRSQIIPLKSLNVITFFFN